MNQKFQTTAASLTAADRLIVALDVPSAALAFDLINRLNGQCRWFKVGLELFLSEGPSIVEKLHTRGLNVFLDLKLHDIPNTIASTVRVIADLRPSLITLHAVGGFAMLQAAQEAAAPYPAMRLLAVTVLTSMDRQQLEATGISAAPAKQVGRLARLALRAGLPGMVCSPEEVAVLRKELGTDPLLIVPGIRPSLVMEQNTAYSDDQRRIASPGQAIALGASMIVVGRPITRSKDPARAAASVLQEIAEAN